MVSFLGLVLITRMDPLTGAADLSRGALAGLEALASVGTGAASALARRVGAAWITVLVLIC